MRYSHDRMQFFPYKKANVNSNQIECHRQCVPASMDSLYVIRHFYVFSEHCSQFVASHLSLIMIRLKFCLFFRFFSSAVRFFYCTNDRVHEKNKEQEESEYFVVIFFSSSEKRLRLHANDNL